MKISITHDFESVDGAIAFLEKCKPAKQTGEPQPEKPVRKSRAKKNESAEVQAKAPEEAQALLEKVVELKGFNTAKALLSRYGISKLRDLPADKVEEFCLHAHKVLDGAPV